MDCCILVIVIIIIVILITFGTMVVGILLGILNVIYLLFLDFSNWIKRISWAKSLTELSYSELQSKKSDLNGLLINQKITDKELRARVRVDEKGKIVPDFSLSWKTDSNATKISDTEARIIILKKLLMKQQPLEDEKLAKKNAQKQKELAEKNAQRQKELDKFTKTSEYKLIEQFALKNPEIDSKEDFSKLQILLEHKSCELSSNELRIFLEQEKSKLYFENAKSKILSNKPTTFDEILREYLSYYDTDDTAFIALETILKEKKLDDLYDSASLKSELEKMKIKIEIEKFEKELNE